MPVVFFVIFLSISSGSIVKVSGSISAKIGLQFSHTKLDVVATYEKGVVMTSFFNPKALMAIWRAIVPFETKNKYLTPRYFLSLSSNSFTNGPWFVTCPLFHILLKYLIYSLIGGRLVFVTLIFFIYYFGIK